MRSAELQTDDTIHKIDKRRFTFQQRDGSAVSCSRETQHNVINQLQLKGKKRDWFCGWQSGGESQPLQATGRRQE